jgi:hypothetical protein
MGKKYQFQTFYHPFGLQFSNVLLPKELITCYSVEVQLVPAKHYSNQQDYDPDRLCGRAFRREFGL